MPWRRPQSLLLFRESQVKTTLSQLTRLRSITINTNSSNCIDCSKVKVSSQTERNARRYNRPSIWRGITLCTAYNNITRAVHMQSVHSTRNNITLTDMDDDDLVQLLVQNGSLTQRAQKDVNKCNNIVNCKKVTSLNYSEYAMEQNENDEDIVGKSHPSNNNNEQEIECNTNKVNKTKKVGNCEREQLLENGETEKADINSTRYDKSSIAPKYVNDTINTMRSEQEHYHQNVSGGNSVSNNFDSKYGGSATQVAESDVKEVSSSFVPVESITESHAFNETYEMFFKIRQHPRNASHRPDGELSWAVNSGMVEWMCCQCQSFNSFSRVVCRKCNASQALSHRCQLPPSRQVVTLPPEWICELCGCENSIRSLEQSLYSSSFVLDNEREVQRQIYSSNSGSTTNNNKKGKRVLTSSTPSHVKDRLRFFCQHCNEPFGGVREWYCSLCHHINPAASMQCATCFMNRSARWQCAYCKCSTNSIFVTTCFQCHKERPRKVSDSTVLCANCNTRNDIRWEICAYCISPLPTMRTSILLANEQNKRSPRESVSLHLPQTGNASVQETNTECVTNECTESKEVAEEKKDDTLTQVNPSVSETSTLSVPVIKEDNDGTNKVILPFESKNIPIIKRPTLPHTSTTITSSSVQSFSSFTPQIRQYVNGTHSPLSANQQDSAAAENLYTNAMIPEPQPSTPTKVNEDWWWCSHCKVFQRRNVVYCDICLTEQPLWDDKGFVVNGYVSTQPATPHVITNAETQSKVIVETLEHDNTTSEATNIRTCNATTNATSSANNDMRVLIDLYDWQCPYCRQYHSVHTHSCCNHRRELPSGYWMCGICHSINRLERVECLGCNAIPQPEPWICPECELENKSDAFSCINCASAHVQLWKCPQCSTINHRVRNTCVTCSERQPERLVSVECPVCGIPNAPARQTCFRCRTYMWSLQWRCASCGFNENTHNDNRCRRCHTPRERSLDDRHWVCELCGGRTCETIHEEVDRSTRTTNSEIGGEENMVVKLDQCPQCYMPRTPNCITYPSWWRCTLCGVYSPAACNKCLDCGGPRRLIGVHISISCPHCSEPTVIDEREECHVCKASLSTTLSDITTAVSIGSAVDLITTATSHDNDSGSEDDNNKNNNMDDVFENRVNVKSSDGANDKNESDQNVNEIEDVLEDGNENIEESENALNNDDDDIIQEENDELLHSTNEMKTFTDDYTELSLDDSAVTLNSFAAAVNEDEEEENEESSNETSLPLHLTTKYYKNHVQESYIEHMEGKEQSGTYEERILHLPMAPCAHTRYYSENNNTNSMSVGNDSADYIYEQTQQENDVSDETANYEQEQQEHQEELEPSYSIASWHCENCGAINIKGENEVCVNCQLARNDELPEGVLSIESKLD